MMGVIVSINMAGGYGFIRGDQQRGRADYFFHASALAEPFTDSLRGQRVTFEPTTTDRGRAARQVEVIA